MLEALTKHEWLSSFKAVGEQYNIYPKKALVKKEDSLDVVAEK